MPIDHAFLEEIRQLLRQARQGVLHQVNSIMVKTYFEIGRRIVEQEQNGHYQAVYGSYLLETLSVTLSKEFGKGFSKRNLELIRKFYLTYRIAKSPISQSLSWTHYLHLMRIEDEEERSFYELETASNNWSVRELSRQIDSALYLNTNPKREFDHSRIPYFHLNGLPSNEFNTLLNQKSFFTIWLSDNFCPKGSVTNQL